MVEYHSGSSDIIQSTDARVAVITKRTIDGPLNIFMVRVSEASARASWLADHFRRSMAAPIQKREERRGPDDEERRVEVPGLVLQDVARRDDGVVGPGVEVLHSDYDRDEQHGHQREVAGARFRHPLDDVPPRAGDQVVQEEDPETPERQAEPEEVPQEVRLEEMVAPHEVRGRQRDHARRADFRGDPFQFFKIRFHVEMPQWDSRLRSSAVSRAASTFLLSCRARTYATIAHRSAAGTLGA